MTAADRLTVLSEYRWPPEPARDWPLLPGYVLSSFSPLIAAAAEGCLADRYADPSADRHADPSADRYADPSADRHADPSASPSRERTAVLLVTAGNDVVSAEHVHDKVASGRRPGPLFFFQTAPNSVLGQVTARWGLGGPVVSISPVGDPLADGLAEAELLLDDGDTDEVLLILAEQDPDAAHALLLSAVAS